MTDTYIWDPDVHADVYEHLHGLKPGSLVKVTNTAQCGDVWPHPGDCMIDDHDRNEETCGPDSDNPKCKGAAIHPKVDDVMTVIRWKYNFGGHASCEFDIEVIHGDGRGWIYGVGIEILQV